VAILKGAIAMWIAGTDIRRLSRAVFQRWLRSIMRGRGFRTNDTRKVLFNTKQIDVISQEAMHHLKMWIISKLVGVKKGENAFF